MSGGEEPALGRCNEAGCTALAVRVASRGSAVPERQPWVCAAGHRRADRRQPSSRTAPANGLSGFVQEVDRIVAAGREARLHAAFASSAAQLVSGPAPDRTPLLQAVTDLAADLLDAGASAVLLSTAGARPVPAAVAGPARPVRLAADAGICSPTCWTGEERSLDDLAAQEHPWPELAAAAREDGLRSAHVLPIRLPDRVAGCLLLLRPRTGPLSLGDAAAARSLCTLAGLTVLLARDRPQQERLQDRLGARVLIEQAKGVLSQRDGLSMDGALAALRRRASDERTSVEDAARRVVVTAAAPRLRR